MPSATLYASPGCRLSRGSSGVTRRGKVARISPPHSLLPRPRAKPASRGPATSSDRAYRWILGPSPRRRASAPQAGLRRFAASPRMTFGKCCGRRSTSYCHPGPRAGVHPSACAKPRHGPRMSPLARLLRGDEERESRTNTAAPLPVTPANGEASKPGSSHKRNGLSYRSIPELRPSRRVMPHRRGKRRDQAPGATPRRLPAALGATILRP